MGICMESEESRNQFLIKIFLLAVFFSFINTPFYFLSSQIGNQPTLAFETFQIPLQVPALIFVLLYLTVSNSPYLLFASFLSIFYFLFSSLPEMPNHRYVIFTVLIYLTFSNKRDITFFSRALISIIYFFAFLAKLNTSYLNPEISCASLFSEQARITSLDFFPSSVIFSYFSIYLSIIFEGLAFIFIFSSRYRFLIVVTGILFHFGLSLDLIKYFTNFSSIMYFLLLNCLGLSFREKAEQIVLDLAQKQYIRLGFKFFLLLCFSLCILSGLPDPEYQTYYLKLLISCRHIFWVIIAFLAFYIVLKTRPLLSQDREIFLFSNLAKVICLVFTLSALSPYLGFKTRSSLIMYSNLRMESEYSNHLLFSRSLNVLGYLSDYAEVLSSKNSCTSSLKDNYTYPLFEIARVEAKCPGEVEGIYYHDELLESSTVDLRQVLGKYNSSLLFKFLVFGPLGPGAERECVW